MSDRLTWLIGSAPDCDVVVDRDTVWVEEFEYRGAQDSGFAWRIPAR